MTQKPRCVHFGWEVVYVVLEVPLGFSAFKALETRSEIPHLLHSPFPSRIQAPEWVRSESGDLHERGSVLASRWQVDTRWALNTSHGRTQWVTGCGLPCLRAGVSQPHAHLPPPLSSAHGL